MAVHLYSVLAVVSKSVLANLLDRDRMRRIYSVLRQIWPQLATNAGSFCLLDFLSKLRYVEKMSDF